MSSFFRRNAATILVPLAAFVLCSLITRQIYRAWFTSEKKQQEQQIAQWKGYLDQALEAEAKGDHQHAIEHLTQAESVAPKTMRSYQLLAEAFVSLGETDRATKCMENAIQLAPPDQESTLAGWCRLAHGYYAGGQFEDAERILKEDIFPHWPDSSQGHYLEARLLLEDQGQEEKALQHLEQALEGEPDSVPIRYEIGVCLSRMGRLEEARTILTEIVKSHPNYSSAQYELAQVLKRQGNAEAARVPLKKFQEYEEMTRRRDILNAHLALDRATPEHVWELAEIYFKMEDYDKARRAVEKYIISDADVPRGHRRLAEIYKQLKQPELAAAEERIADALEDAQRYRGLTSDTDSQTDHTSEAAVK